MNKVIPPLPTETLANARHLRKTLTDAERKLWSRLRGKQVRDLKFRRQHPIPPYIADSCCIERKLIIELDGSQHNEIADETRTRNLESRGWHVLRYWDNDVLSNTDAVLEAIWSVTAGPNPHPHPSPDGRGAFEQRR